MSAARKILMAQLMLGTLMGIAAWLLVNATAGYSAALGAAICVIPNAYLAMRMMAATPSQDAGKMLRATWFGEIGKLIITGVLFTVVFVVVKPLSPGALLIGFMAAQSGIWLAIMRDPTALND